jgi:hypothetical protein
VANPFIPAANQPAKKLSEIIQGRILVSGNQPAQVFLPLVANQTFVPEAKLANVRV